jgi:hypothetical protein
MKKYYLSISGFSSDTINFNRNAIKQKIEDLVIRYQIIVDEFKKELNAINFDKKNMDQIYNDISRMRFSTSDILNKLNLIKMDIEKYKKYYEDILKNDNEENFIDIVDVSFNFRFLKLKILKSIDE